MQKKIIPKKVKNSGYVGKIINKKSVIDHYGDNQDVIIANAGPGHWNDPDMVRIFCLRHFINLI